VTWSNIWSPTLREKSSCLSVFGCGWYITCVFLALSVRPREVYAVLNAVRVS